MVSLLAHIGHLEITTPDVDASVSFYKERLGLSETERVGDSVYLRCWGDYYTYSLVISKGERATLAVMAWRTTSDAALDEAVANIEKQGLAGSWLTDQPHHGRSYRFTGPYGHTMELYWEQERFHAEGAEKSQFVDRPSRRSNVGASPRFLDHVTVAASDVRGFCDWYSETFGFRTMAYTVLDHIPLTVFGVLTTNEKSHDLGVVLDGSSVAGRINHFAFWVDSREDLLNVADIVMERGIPMEYGPSIHGIGEQSFLYFREPSGMRIEVNTGGYRNYVPDWEPSDWTPASGSNSIYRNGAMPESMTESFPLADGPSATEEGILPGTEDALINNPYAVQGRG
ncbi:catechol 2,3-dioxygenase [soil metagenome]